MLTQLEIKPRRCLAPKDFEDLDNGNLSDPELDQVFEHISTCPACETFLQKWQSAPDDLLSDKLRKCFARVPIRPVPALTLIKANALDQTGSVVTRDRNSVAPDNAAFSRSLIGTRIGQNRILEEIGRGGMGIVFRAQQESVKRQVAIKIIRSGFYAQSSVITRFRTEAGAIARLQHPNVVQIHEFSQHEDLPYFVMEWVEGGSLEKTLDNGPLSFRRAAELTRIIAGAVEFAHQKQVIHRDLKPSNILMTHDGVPKIADFGLAKLLDEQGNETQTDMILGTPNYMAPEQAAGRTSEIGPVTDVYSLGAILYEIMTGQPPFKGTDRLNTMRLVREVELTPPSKLQPGIPKNLEAICVKCLAKTPSRRYQSAQAFADDLTLWLADERPRGIPGVVGRGVTRLRRNRVAAALGVICLIFVVALYLRDPDRPLRELQAKLAKGEPATLIAEKGNPTWFRWLEGEDSSKMVIGKDGTVVIHASDRAMLQLLPSVEAERYRFQVRIRHEKSSLPGEVGIFFAHNSISVNDVPVHFFVQLTFNDIRGKKDLPIIIGKWPVPQVPNFARMLAHFYSRPTVPPKVDSEMCAKYGLPFDPVGEREEGWRDLAVTVTPEGITAEWDGHQFGMSTDDIKMAIDREIAYLQKHLPLSTVLTVPRPIYTPRGSLGLFIERGSAAFCSATLIPKLEH